MQSSQESGRWLLQLFIQAKDDPSLMISLDDFRKNSTHPIHGIYLDQRFFGIETFIHTELEGIFQFFILLQRIITPLLKTQISITTFQAFQFLKSACPQIRQTKKNIGIIVPP